MGMANSLFCIDWNLWLSTILSHSLDLQEGEEKMSIFRAYDVRGIYPTNIDEKIAFKIGKAFGTFNPGKIVVGHDTRSSSPILKDELIKGLISTGATVIDIGTVPTPLVLFSTRLLKSDGGICVTASHNPKEYNGFKFNDKNAVPISYESGLSKIQEIFEKEDFIEGEGNVTKKNVIDDYVKFILSKVDIKTPVDFEIVVDAGNGTAGLIYPKILKKLGLKVHELYCNPDGNFPHHIPDPSQKENLVDLQKKVVDVKADFGLAYDGDGDRLGVIDEDGNIIDNNKIFALLIKNTLRKKINLKVVYDALSSRMIEDVIKNQGGIAVVCKVGHTYITQKMIEENAILAGELSGHYYFKETYSADDALFASLMLIEYLSKTKKKLTEHFKDLPKYFSQATEGMRYPIKESEKFKFIEVLKKEFKNKGCEIDVLDGVKVIFKDGWALFRPSNTEAIISMSFEATTKEGFERIKKFVESIIARIPK